MSIDRRAVVGRHNVILTAVDILSPLSVGNGEFAFTADITGLQTFPDIYGIAEGIPLCTQSQWGWHSGPPTNWGLQHGKAGEFDTAELGGKLRHEQYEFHGRPLPYATSNTGQESLFNYLRENPHRLHLGRIGLELRKADGTLAKPEDLKEIRQELDLWSGLIHSRFLFEGVPVEVETTGMGAMDGVSVRVRSRLVGEGHVKLLVAFPYGSHLPLSADWSKPDAHTTIFLSQGETRGDFQRTLDSDTYVIQARWNPETRLIHRVKHEILAESTGEVLEFSALFLRSPSNLPVPTFDECRTAHASFMQSYWTSGGAIDLSGSTDTRAIELERRAVLSQYLMGINCAGSLPPQETGLTYNSWYGKFHLEMHWWHAVHFALWGREPLFEKSMAYYAAILPAARELANYQGFTGARWPKMTDRTGRDSPSPVGPLLLWQQPHPIYYAEMYYRAKPTRETLEQWRVIVEETAEFMADFAKAGSGDLGPPLKTVSENTDQRTTKNGTFDLAYWRIGLEWAQRWRERLQLPRSDAWDKVIASLPPLPQAQGMYLLQDGMADTYTKWNWEHPALVGIMGMLPGNGVDPVVFKRSVEKVMEVWEWERTWGWDFPMMAMACARSGRPDLAINALLIDAKKNYYSAAGHNYQRPNLTTYFPGNGGLAALAMMCAGWDRGPATHAPGFPDTGFNVQFEGLKPIP